MVRALRSKEIEYATGLSLATCTLTALLSLVIAVPAGYLMSRSRFPGKRVFEALLDVPIVLPPMAVGLCLLILFQTPIGLAVQKVVPFTYTVNGVLLAQLVVALRSQFGRCVRRLTISPRVPRTSP